ncbi:MAG: 6,7-dimethyl-8-ribityllumazine synthase [Deltaproteobacteria bacterium CG11_big_fil_rev_8_21_14_0_20_47_16]|nr:MAG: 6,7-dimethyl-8-ribityllumazine synthase [Deltaproteobacteria bacterium CG11_big_fil_rev_8_21_14_0_20_47_16]
MSIICEEILSAKDKRVAIVVSRFNHHITDALLQDALEAFEKLDGKSNTIDVAYVPGAFEIPVVAKKFAQSKKYDGILCLGCVIQGGTPHFQYVCQGVTDGVMQAMLETNTPMSFGVLTTDTLQQAAERSAGKEGSKGREAMLALLETIQVLKKV